MSEHEHEWRFAPNIEQVSPARTNTYGFYCTGSECDEYILLPEVEQHLNVHSALRAVTYAVDGFLDMLDSGGGNVYLPDNIDLGLLRRTLDAVSPWVLKEGR